MTTTAASGAAVPAHGKGVGPLLRAWRDRRRVSQLELALRADSSARHIGFIETGRSRPSEEMVLRLWNSPDLLRRPSAGRPAGGHGAADPGLRALPGVVVDALYEEVATHPVPDTAVPEDQPAEPVVYFVLPMQIEHDGRMLSFVSSISTFNPPLDVTVSELAVETLLPADPVPGTR